MGRAIRTTAAAGCGFAAGLALGPCSMLMAAVSDTLVRGWPWPKMDFEYRLMLLATSVPAGVNGTIGAALAAGLGSRGRLGITLLPAALHTVGAIGCLIADAREFLLFQLVALMFSVVIWPTGRLGQSIGWAIRCSPPYSGSLDQADNRMTG